MMKLIVLRLFHRHIRDKRISTHLALTARTFGAKKIVYTGDHDKRMEETVSKVVKDWGGDFKIDYLTELKQFIDQWKKEKGIVVHLTMFGKELSEKIKDLREIQRNMLVIVGGAKVPIDIYKKADYNVAIGHQPHSEVAALAVFLNEITQGKARTKIYENAKIEIIPTEGGKKAINK